MDSPARLRFGRRRRLIRRRDFERVYRDGGRTRGELVRVVALPNGGDTSRLGLSVGKAIWKSAVRRNRVRRVLREAFRLALPDLPAGVDVILIPARAKLDPELEATRRELVRLVPKAARRARPPGDPPAPRAEAAP